MSVINSQPLIGASGNQGVAGYNLTRSLRFRSSASAYLNRTPASAGNRRTWTWSGWVKRGALGVEQYLFTSDNGNGDDNELNIILRADNAIQIGGGQTNWRITTQVFRDPSAWYHLVFAFDTTQATGSNRIRIYVNGSEITAFTTNNNPSQNADLAINQATAHNIGRRLDNTFYFDGYLAEVNFIDGQQLTPSDFGETDTSTGVWKPKKYTGTYGTNGFYLKFDNITSTSTLGNDSSGNNNTWTVNNISLTSGATYDSMKDVPTLTDADTANYCVLNRLNARLSSTTITNGNLKFTKSSSSDFAIIYGSQGVSTGKWYFEANIVSRSSFLTLGFYNGSAGPNTDADTDNARYQLEAGTISKTVNGSSSQVATGKSTSNGLIGIAIDCDAGEVSFYHTNTLQATATGLRTNQTYFPRIYVDGTSNSSEVDFNFGQRPFAYTPPSGFKALNTFNLPTPTIGATASTQANKYMDATTYTGNGSTQSIVNAGGFQPDLVWLKARSQAYFNNLNDSVRGTNRRLFSNTTDVEDTTANCLTAFNSNGFSIGSNQGINENTTTYVAWQWNGGGSNATNTSGTITSTVRANTSAGFSIVTYTGNGVSNATVGHGLGVAPKLVILKSRSSNSTSNNWWVNHASLSSGNNLYLNLGDAQFAISGTTSGGLGTLSSTTFTLANGASNNNNVNQNSGTFVAYCFAEVDGFSKFGSYTGNGSTDGPFVYTGFRPRFIIIKSSSTGGASYDWFMFDTSRSSFNVVQNQLVANSANAEGTGTAILDAVSNGFKMRINNLTLNNNGSTYIYAAFAENPFKYSLAR